VNLITYKNYTLVVRLRFDLRLLALYKYLIDIDIDIDIQSISHLGFRPHRHVYTTMTQQNIAYNWNIINMSTLTHALWLLVP